MSVAVYASTLYHHSSTISTNTSQQSATKRIMGELKNFDSYSHRQICPQSIPISYVWKKMHWLVIYFFPTVYEAANYTGRIFSVYPLYIVTASHRHVFRGTLDTRWFYTYAHAITNAQVWTEFIIEAVLRENLGN